MRHFLARARRHVLKYGGEFVDFVPVRAGGAFLYDATGSATQAMFVKQGPPMMEAACVWEVVVEVGGGLAILFGAFTRPVGLVLAIWCVATGPIAHSNIAERAQEISSSRTWD